MVELTSRYKKYYLGFLWWFIEPITYFSAFYLLFAVGLRFTSGPNYLSFLLVGVANWRFISGTVPRASMSILANQRLLQQIYLPKWIFPSVKVLVAFVEYLIVFTLLVITLLVIKRELFIQSTVYYDLIPVFIAYLVLVTGISFFFAAITPFVPDLKLALQSATRLLFFLSGVFYDVTEFSERVQTLFYYNPMVLVILSFRRIIIDHQAPPWGGLVYVVLIGLEFFLLGLILLRFFDRKYLKLLKI